MPWQRRASQKKREVKVKRNETKRNVAKYVARASRQAAVSSRRVVVVKHAKVPLRLIGPKGPTGDGPLYTERQLVSP